MNFIPYMIALSTIPATAMLIKGIRSKKWVEAIAALVALLIIIVYMIYKILEKN